jgi:hypothetical protein
MAMNSHLRQFLASDHGCELPFNLRRSVHRPQLSYHTNEIRNSLIRPPMSLFNVFDEYKHVV